jgi:HK97 family phage major capsid protein
MTHEEKAAQEIADKLKAQAAQVESLKNEVESLKSQGKAVEAVEKALETAQKALEALETFKANAEKDLADMQAELAKAKKGNANSEGYKTLKEALTAAFEEKAEEISAILKNGGKQKESLHLEVSTKTVIDMGELNTIGSGTTQNLLTQNTGIISTIRSRELRYAANVSTGSIGNERALWVEEEDEQGNPIFIGEGDGKTKLSVKYVEKTESVKKIAVFGKITTEMMADLPQLISYIQNNLIKRLDIVTEDKLMGATGTGDDPKGIEYFATAFTGGSLVDSVDNANELDVIEAIALQVKEAHGIPNTLFIHPSTMSAIKLIKDDAKRPVWKDYVTTNGMMNVSGMNLIETTAITAGDFVGGDTSVVNLLYREQLGIQIGLDGNDFTQNKKTMLVEKRLVQFVSANDTPVLVKGDFTTAKAAIEKP